MKATGRGSKTGLRVERRFTADERRRLCRRRVVDADLAHHQPGRLGRLRDERRRDPAELVAGRHRHHGRASISARPACRRSTPTAIRSWTRSGNPVLGPERSARQVIHRLAGCWRYWGESTATSPPPATPRRSTTSWPTCSSTRWPRPTRRSGSTPGSPSPTASPAPPRATTTSIPPTGEVKSSDDAYTRPQPHACFIQSVDDDLVGEGGIMDLWVREARLFKYGSGTGTNFSSLRGEGEKLSGGGTSLRPDELPRVGDRAAGAIKSGGTTRRAAKMVCLDIDHPDIEDFINWKVDEEKKVAALIAAGYSSDFNGEAYATVTGQNSNNSVRVTERLHRARSRRTATGTDAGAPTGEVSKTLKARDLWRQIAEAAWQCADPGVQYDTTINEWHTCPKAGRINACNPCSEYMFLDNTACNLAQPEPDQVPRCETGEFDVEGYRHAVRLWTIVLEISVLMAQFPSKEIARHSYDYRTLGLGYANLGTVLMLRGLPYDSDEAAPSPAR